MSSDSSSSTCKCRGLSSTKIGSKSHRESVQVPVEALFFIGVLKLMGVVRLIAALVDAGVLFALGVVQSLIGVNESCRKINV